MLQERDYFSFSKLTIRLKEVWQLEDVGTNAGYENMAKEPLKKAKNSLSKTNIRGKSISMMVDSGASINFMDKTNLKS